MADFRIRETGEVVSQGELRRRYSNTSFPAVWNSDVTNFLGVDPIFESPQPTNTDPLKHVRLAGIIQDVRNNWVQNWEVVDIFSGSTKAEDEAAFMVTRSNNQWLSIRSQRDQLLKDTDWVTIRAADTGVELTTEWAEYRQALRDITEQTDPFDITWPTKPE